MESTAKKNEQRAAMPGPTHAARARKLASAPTIDEALELASGLIQDFGVAVEKILLNRNGQTNALVNQAARSTHHPTEIMAIVAEGRISLTATCSGSISPELREGIESVLQLGALSAEVCARRTCKPLAEGAIDHELKVGAVPSRGQLQNLEVERIARADAAVLVTGERGTGKTTMAKAIHEQSARAAGPWVEVDCTAIAENLFESELFGHEKGAFTDAKTAKQGLFETADGGTLFLDEIAELPLPLQAKLLKAIEQQTIRRLGSTQDKKVNVRIIAATSQDLAAMKDEGHFREDLFDRLSVLEIRPCPLREKREEIPTIIFQQLKEEERKAKKKQPLEIERRAVELLQAYNWPGNIRELKNFVTRLVVNVEGTLPITVEDVQKHLSFKEQNLRKRGRATGVGGEVKEDTFIVTDSAITLPDDVRHYHLGETMNEYLERTSRSLIEAVLSQNNNQIKAAAQAMGIPRKTLECRVRKLNMTINRAA